MSERVAVLGAGAWGTALAIHAARCGHRVALWARDPVRAAEMRAAGANARLLPGARFPQGLSVTTDAEAALEGAALVLLAVPMQPLAAALRALPPLAAPILCCKGFEAGTLRLPLEVAGGRGGVLSGPNFAHEVAAGLPAAAVVASRDAALAARAQALLSAAALRLYTSDDPVGVQVGGAAKNVLAIAAGVALGAGFGENARAALVTRGLAELSRLAVALGGRAETAAGLSGLGDLLLTACGERSRNASLGLSLGRGVALEEALAGRAGVTEGVATAPALLARGRAAGVELPICGAVAALLEGAVTVREAMEGLLSRAQRSE